MSKELTDNNPGHVNPYGKAVSEHVPVSGDVYVYRSPSGNGFATVRLKERQEKGGYYRWTFDLLTGSRWENTISEEDLKRYYRPLLNGYDEILSLAQMTLDGRAAEAAALIGAGEEKSEPGSEALMETETPEHIKALLDTSESLENKLKEVRLMTEILIEAKKAELRERLNQMEGYLKVMGEKVKSLEKIISVLNIYTGRTVDLHAITEGEGASEEEPLSLRQRIIFMDEELCVHLDYESDYKDVNLFFEWLKEPQNRDIVIPEKRSIVALKPKRHDMNYRSGDRMWDAIQNQWNKHTYLLIRNGDNLWWAESDDLEVYDWTFPHEDFEEKFQEEIKKDRSFVDSKIKSHDNVKYRITKYMTFIQGLIDQRPDIIGKMTVRPNLLKLVGVRLIRDDENLVGTGRKPWRDFLKEKNATIRRGTRIVYIAGQWWRGETYNRKCADSGGFVKYYSNSFSMPGPPSTGLYSADTVETVVRYEKGQPVKETFGKLVIKYLPGDEIFVKTEWDYRLRKNRVSWFFDEKFVINYDAVTLEELRGYMEDRTLRSEFASMLPLLREVLHLKVTEEEDERAFKTLLGENIHKETGKAVPPEVMDEAITWWKEKVIFTRPLRSDDKKAWSMIRNRITKQIK